MAANGEEAGGRPGPRHSYEPFALQYDRGSADNPFNARLDRRAIGQLCGDVSGLRVLDAGCAGGHLTRWLAGHGARVWAVDASPTLAALARRRCPGADIRQHDLRLPFGFLASGSLDLVVSSLTMHYLRDWGPTLREFRRLLSPRGRLVLSTHHPLLDFAMSPTGDYHATELLEDQWHSYGPPPLVVRFYRRPLARMVADARSAGFALTGLVEPRPAESDRAAFGDKFDQVARQPPFLVMEFVPAG